MRVAAIFPVGTSMGGCPDAIAEILKSESSLEVYLLYGDRGAPDAGDPKDSVEQIQKNVRDPRLTWAQCQAVQSLRFLRDVHTDPCFCGRNQGAQLRSCICGHNGRHKPDECFALSDRHGLSSFSGHSHVRAGERMHLATKLRGF